MNNREVIEMFNEVADMLEDSHLPAMSDEIAGIQDTFGEMAPQIIADQAPFLNCTERRYDEVKRKIDVDFIDGGVQKLKNIEDPIRLYHCRFGNAPASASTGTSHG